MRGWRAKATSDLRPESGVSGATSHDVETIELYLLLDGFDVPFDGLADYVDGMF